MENFYILFNSNNDGIRIEDLTKQTILSDRINFQITVQKIDKKTNKKIKAKFKAYINFDNTYNICVDLSSGVTKVLNKFESIIDLKKYLFTLL